LHRIKRFGNRVLNPSLFAGGIENAVWYKKRLNGSVEIVQDMFVKTLLGVSPPARPPHACGKLGNILSNISCEPVLSFGHDRHSRDAISVKKSTENG
jgi:hypothetical protein